MSVYDGWRSCWAEPDTGLWALERADGTRMRAELRGGIAWPEVRRVGSGQVAAGALLVLGFVPRPGGGAGDGVVHDLGGAAFGALAPAADAGGWPVDLGAAGAVADAAGFFGGMRRFYASMGEADQVDWVRALRRMLSDRGAAATGARFRAWGIEEGAFLDGIIWRWAQAGRLRLRDATRAAMDANLKQWSDAGPQPWRDALAATLWSWDRRPWALPRMSDPWRPVENLAGVHPRRG